MELVASETGATHVRLRVFGLGRGVASALLGCPYDEAPGVVARLCGMCPVSHQLAAVQAIENALGVTPTPQTGLLRRVLGLAQWIQSHALHIYLLAAPDFLGCGSAYALASRYPDLVHRALRIKKLGAELTRAVAGPQSRSHTWGVYGFRHLPSPGVLERLRARLERGRQEAADTVAFVSSLEFPSLPRKAELVALRGEEGYPVNTGCVASTEGMREGAAGYRESLHAMPLPLQPDQEVLRWGIVKRSSFMVGPLARLSLNTDQLSPAGRRALRACGVSFPSHNPFHSVAARAVELAEAMDECARVLDALHLKKEETRFAVRAGAGTACVEAPRGVLYHYYRLNAAGCVEAAEIIAPTACNVWSLEEDLRALVPQVQHLPNEEKKRLLEMLVRSYDPCLSCSLRAPSPRAEGR
ncbi:MAG: nickel-dependent hydrogenase large subunit [Armatimonadota bacterium]|nr:nickel-dependent hydrogenase large subunit [Armatimonadota bacterium]